MSLEGKKDTDKWFPVILTDDSDFKTAETGKVFGDVTCKYSYEAAESLSTHTITTDEWKEAGEGKYWLKIGYAEFANLGKYEVSVTVVGCLVFNFVVEIRDKMITTAHTDIESEVDSVFDDVADVKGVVDDIQTAVGIVDGIVDDIKIKTVNLPVDTEGHLNDIEDKVDNTYDRIDDTIVLVTAVQSAVATVDGIVDDIKSYLMDGGRIDLLLDTIITNLAAVQADLDTPDQYKADVSALATSVALAVIGGVVVAIKAKTDTLGGAGAIEWEYTLTDADTGNPISDADVWVTSDLAGNIVIATGRTDAYGKVIYFLDAGEIFVWRQKSGWDFVNPDQELVS